MADPATVSVIQHLLDGELPMDGLWADREGWPDLVSDGVPVTPDEEAVLASSRRKVTQLTPPVWTPEMRRYMEQVRNDKTIGIRLRKRPERLDGKIIMPTRRNLITTRWLRVRWVREPSLAGFFHARITIGRFEFVLDPIPKKSWRK